MSSRTSPFVLPVYLIACSSPFNVKSDGSNSRPLHMSHKSVAAISPTSLCRNVTNPPFLDDLTWRTLKPSPQKQLNGKPEIGQPYQNLIESQNCCLFNTWLNSRIAITVSQFDYPVSFEMSLQRFLFSFMEFFSCSNLIL